MSRSIFSLAGRVGGHARAALYDGAAMTAKARQTFTASFRAGHACKVCPAVTLPADLLPGERERRAEALRRAHYARVALASARARSMKDRHPAKVTTQEDGDATADPRRRAA